MPFFSFGFINVTNICPFPFHASVFSPSALGAFSFVKDTLRERRTRSPFFTLFYSIGYSVQCEQQSRCSENSRLKKKDIHDRMTIILRQCSVPGLFEIKYFGTLKISIFAITIGQHAPTSSHEAARFLH